MIVGRLTKAGYSDWTLISSSLLVVALSYSAMGLFVTNLFSFCVVIFPMVVAGAVFSLIVQSMLTKTVTSDDTGKLHVVGAVLVYRYSEQRWSPRGHILKSLASKVKSSKIALSSARGQHYFLNS